MVKRKLSRKESKAENPLAVLERLYTKKIITKQQYEEKKKKLSEVSKKKSKCEHEWELEDDDGDVLEYSCNLCGKTKYVDKEDVECDHDWELDYTSSYDAEFRCHKCGERKTIDKDSLDYSSYGIPSYQRERAKERIKEKGGSIYGEDSSLDGSTSENKTSGSSCFIATAAYGTPFAQEIDILRDWRDKSLKTNYLGNMFVKFYYWFSPPVADFIRSKPLLRRLVRICLNPVVRYLKK